MAGLDSKNAPIYQSQHFKRFLVGKILNPLHHIWLWSHLTLTSATQLASILLVAYSAYRIAEMVQRLDGALFQNQILFLIMNGVLPLLAAALITLQHPGRAFGSAWGPTSPTNVQKRRHAPAPLRPHPSSVSYRVHERYDPTRREQRSPTSLRHLRHYSNPPEVPQGSPGLPLNPKPVHKNKSPMPSPTNEEYNVASVETRYSLRAERRAEAPAKNKLVQEDTLW